MQSSTECPISHSPLAVSDLIEVKASQSAPKPPNATSIPALLVALQNEWDAAMLEVLEFDFRFLVLIKVPRVN